MATLRDIAERTGFNVSTVSRALRGAVDISPQTIELVRRTALQMGYHVRPKAARKRTIGLIVPEVVSHYYAEMTETIHKKLEKRGYSMITIVGGFNVNSILDAYDELLMHDVCGIIINDCFHIDSNESLIRHERFSHSMLPIIMISDNEMSEPIDRIRIDEKKAVHLIMEHLVELGHRRIAYIGEFASDTRYDGYLESMRSFGLKVCERHIKRGKERFELGGFLRAKDLMKETDFSDITAVIASYDQVAMGAINAFTEVGVRVPEDISIASFDNIILNDFSSIQLTSISPPIEQLCTLSVKILLDSIEMGEEHVVQDVTLLPRIVVRTSTAEPKKHEEG